MSDYCPKCKSRLYPLDTEYIKNHNMCSYCVTFTNQNKMKGVKHE